MSSNEMPDRPAALARRTRPKAAADEAVDPADLSSTRQAPNSQPAPAPRRRRAVTVQLAVRVPEEIADRVAAEAAAQGITQRQVIEDLVREHL